MQANALHAYIARRPICAASALIALCLIAVPCAGRADDVSDTDGDGVADAVDACPDTDVADVVGPDGCTLCSCENGVDGAGWSSHGEYLSCMRTAIRTGRKSGALGASDARRLMRAARFSTCGSPALVRCCVFAKFDDDVGSCRIMSEDACNALDDRLFDNDGEADSEDAGSCLPNPCTF